MITSLFMSPSPHSGAAVVEILPPATEDAEETEIRATKITKNTKLETEHTLCDFCGLRGQILRVLRGYTLLSPNTFPSGSTTWHAPHGFRSTVTPSDSSRSASRFTSAT